MTANPEPLDAQITTRVPSRVRREIDALARAAGSTPLSLARRLLEEGVRRESHPGITFRAGAAGRRASLEGRRIDVWQIMETLWASDGDVDAAASSLDLRPEEVRTALAYFADYPAEVEDWIRRNREQADAEEDAWRRRRAALRR